MDSQNAEKFAIPSHELRVGSPTGGSSTRVNLVQDRSAKAGEIQQTLVLEPSGEVMLEFFPAGNSDDECHGGMPNRVAEADLSQIIRIEHGTDELWPELYGFTRDGRVFQTFLLDTSPDTFEAAVLMMETKASQDAPCFAGLGETQLAEML